MRSLLVALLLLSGCYHYRFDLRPAAETEEVVVHEIRAATWINGFVGTGRVDATSYCDRPLRTELRVTAVDVVLSVATLLIYTPHTLYVTCPRPAAGPGGASATGGAS